MFLVVVPQRIVWRYDSFLGLLVEEQMGYRDFFSSFTLFVAKGHKLGKR